MVPTSLRWQTEIDTAHQTNWLYLADRVAVPGMLHAHEREGLPIVPAVIPVGVPHEDPTLHIAEGDGGCMSLSTGRDGDHPAWVEGTSVIVVVLPFDWSP